MHKTNSGWFKNGHKIRLGIPHTEAARKLIGLKLKGRIPWNKGKKGVQIWSDESRKKLKESLKGRQLSPIKFGKESPNYKNGHSLTKNQIMNRDNYTCQICGLRDPEIMELDHIKPKSTFPELQYDINNLMVLCPNCHRRKTNRELKQNIFYQ